LMRNELGADMMGRVVRLSTHADIDDVGNNHNDKEQCYHIFFATEAAAELFRLSVELELEMGLDLLA